MLDISRTRNLVANNIVYYRLKNDWSQEEFADKLSSSTSYISEMENCKRNISIDYIDVLAKTFGIEPHELFAERSPVLHRRKKRNF